MNPIVQAKQKLDAARAALAVAERDYAEVETALANTARATPYVGISLEEWAEKEAARTSRREPLERLKQEQGRALTAARHAAQQAEQGVTQAEEARVLWRQRAAAHQTFADMYGRLCERLTAIRADLQGMHIDLQPLRTEHREAHALERLSEAASLAGAALTVLEEGNATYEGAAATVARYEEDVS